MSEGVYVAMLIFAISFMCIFVWLYCIDWMGRKNAEVQEEDN